MSKLHKNEGKFSHCSILTQLVDKLYHVAEEKLTAGQKHDNIPELSQLWKNILHSAEPIAGIGSCKVILFLVAEEKLDMVVAFEKILNCCSSTSNLQWVIYLTFHLLKQQFLKQYQQCSSSNQLSFKSPYQLRSPAHPLIFIVAASPKSWNSVISELHSMLLECTSSGLDSNFTVANAIDTLKPFLLYVFFNPSNEIFSQYQISTLFDTLICYSHFSNCGENKTLFHHNNETPLISFLSKIVTSVIVSEDRLPLFTQLVIAIESSSNVNNNVLISELCHSLLSSCLQSIHCTTSTSTAHLLYKFIKSSLLHIKRVDIITIGLSQLLCKASTDTLKWLLHSCLEIITSLNWKSVYRNTKLICLSALKAAVLPILLNKKAVGYQPLLPLINIVLEKLNECLNEDESEYVTSNVCCSMQLSILLQSIALMLEAFSNSNFQISPLRHLQFILQLHSSPDTALNISLLVCGILLSDTIAENYHTISHDNCLQFLNQICSAHPELILVVLPTIFYLIKTEKKSQYLKNLVLLLPKLAIHNDCIAPILTTIQAFCKVPSLHPLAIELLLQMWKKQERVFPYLQKMMLQSSQFHPILRNELNMAKAVAIKEMSSMRPFKNTSEILACIASMLSMRMHTGNVVILLEGLYCLMQNEVINLQSTWNELKDRILANQSDIVLKATLKILSLTPKFEENTTSYLQFKDEVLSWIWNKLENQSMEVSASCLVCLAHFNKEDFSLKHLPARFRPQQTDIEESIDDFLLKPIPGYCYLKLIESQSSMQAKYFLSSLLDQEIQNLPRDIKHRAMQSQKKFTSPNVLNNLTDFALKSYERNKLPNLKSAFATALLMCYNAQLEGSSPNQLISFGRNAIQHLQSLLSEVSVDPKNWRLMLWLAQAWMKFMLRCFNMMVAGRKAELKLQLQKKDCDKDDVLHKLVTVDFWCRDKITDVLKSASRGTPSMQGNAALGLAGLIHVIKSHIVKVKEAEEDSTNDKEGTGFLSYVHWIGMAADTIISIVDSKYQPSGRIFSWCQYKSVSHSGRLTTSKLGEISAMHSLKILLPALLPHDSKRVASILNVLLTPVAKLSNMEQSQDYDANSVTTTNLYLALGGVVSKLFTENFSEICNLSLKQNLNESVSLLTKHIFPNPCEGEQADFDNDCSDDENSDIFLGSMLGVGQLLPSMFFCNDVSVKEKAKSVFVQLNSQFFDLDEQSNSYLDAFYSTLSWGYISGKTSLVLDDNSSTNTFEKFYEKLLENKNNIALSQSVASICFAMQLSEEPQSVLLFDDLLKQWSMQATNERLSTRQKLSAIHGLAALVGSDSIFTQQVSKCTTKAKESLNKVVKILQRVSSSLKDPGTSSNAMLLLGHLYIASQAVSSQTLSVPSSYAYLPESSVLRPMFGTLTEVQINKKNFSDKNMMISVILNSLADVASSVNKPLPPVNWSVQLHSLLQLNPSEKQQNSCFEIAISQCIENLTAVAFLTDWMQDKLFKTLYTSTQCILLKSIHIIIGNLPSANVLSFLDFIGLLPLDCYSLCHAILHGILLALKLDNLPQGVPNCLHHLTRHFTEKYSFIIDNVQMIDQWKLIAQCILQSQDFDLTVYDLQENFALRILFVKCHLVSQGFKPVQWLDNSIRICASHNKSDVQTSSLLLLYECFVDIINLESLSHNKEKFVEWVQELMGCIYKLSAAEVDLSGLFLLKVFAVAIIALSKKDTSSKQGNVDELFSSTLQRKCILWDHCLNVMVFAMKDVLLQKMVKDKFFNEIVEWLLYLCQNNFKLHTCIKTCLCQIFLHLRLYEPFTKMSLWTNVVSVLFLPD